jgi:uncharacterized membrane protein
MADEALRTQARSAPAVLAAAVVALQIGYPLTHGSARDHLTVAIVVALAAACIAHAAVTRGARTAGTVLLLTAVPGYLVEVLGVHTGVPFGSYHYAPTPGAPTLGPLLFGAPPLIGLAWTMLAWPATVVARHLVRGRVARVLVGAWALASADLFLDPQQVAAGHWSWQFPAPHLSGVPSVPLTNYAGWLATALVISIALQAVTGDRNTTLQDDRVMIAMYLWLYVGWIVALAGFLDLAAAAGWGALGMGLVAVPVAVRLMRR